MQSAVWGILSISLAISGPVLKLCFNCCSCLHVYVILLWYFFLNMALLAAICVHTNNLSQIITYLLTLYTASSFDWPMWPHGQYHQFALSSVLVTRFHGVSKMAVHCFESKDDLQEAICSLIAKQSSAAIENHGFFSVGFSGGSLPNIVCPGLLSAQIDLSNWRVLFCDERYVPLDNKDSNYKAIKEQLLDKTSAVKPENVLAIDSSLPLDDAAKDYETRLKSWYNGSGDGIPQLDMLLLGMGPDGHTCSLFPGHPLLLEKSRLVAPISDSPKPPSCRITLTYPIINAAKCVAFVATGSGKAAVLKKVLEGDDEEPLPSARVNPVKGELHWFLDKDSAKFLATKWLLISKKTSWPTSSL